MNDPVIDGWRCCTGGSLGVRRVAHAPNGSTVELTYGKRLLVFPASFTHAQTTVPAGVVLWLFENFQHETRPAAPARPEASTEGLPDPWEALAGWCAGRPQRRINTELLHGKRAVIAQDGIGNERWSDWFNTATHAAADLCEKLRLVLPSEPAGNSCQEPPKRVV